MDAHNRCGNHRLDNGFMPMNRGRMCSRVGVRRGEFHFLVLLALNDKPMHGYALIQEMERIYQRPTSAGLVYPTLQELQDVGLVVSEEREGKKVYMITTKGKEYLAENADVVSRLKKSREYASKMGEFGFMNDITDIQAMLNMNAEYLDEDKMAKIQEILRDAKRKIAAIVL